MEHDYHLGINIYGREHGLMPPEQESGGGREICSMVNCNLYDRDYAFDPWKFVICVRPELLVAIWRWSYHELHFVEPPAPPIGPWSLIDAGIVRFKLGTYVVEYNEVRVGTKCGNHMLMYGGKI